MLKKLLFIFNKSITFLLYTGKIDPAAKTAGSVISFALDSLKGGNMNCFVCGVKSRA